MSESEGDQIVLFDGVCHLCDYAVRFIMRWEKTAEIKFAPLQSAAGKALLKKYGYPENYLGSLLYIEQNRVHNRSSACLRIAGKLKFPWSMALFFLITPKALRDLFYLGVAGIRYRWFGKKETCSLPKAKDLGRFL